MAKVRVQLDSDAQQKVCNLDGMFSTVNKKAEAIASQANAMSAGFRTGRFYDKETHEMRGNTQPRYAAVKAMKTRKGAVALVHNANYAAYRDCLEHNTLLKVR